MYSSASFIDPGRLLHCLSPFLLSGVCDGSFVPLTFVLIPPSYDPCAQTREFLN